MRLWADFPGLLIVPRIDLYQFFPFCLQGELINQSKRKVILFFHHSTDIFRASINLRNEKMMNKKFCMRKEKLIHSIAFRTRLERANTVVTKKIVVTIDLLT